MYKLAVFIPTKYVEKVKNAMFDAGGGQIGNYDRCCFQTKGTGQFRPGQDSQPFFGTHGNVEYVEEVKVEMVCSQSAVREVISAMKQAHPYETPAYNVLRIEEI
jgi:hypothetical protein